MFVHPVTFARNQQDDDLFGQLAAEELGRLDDDAFSEPVSRWFPGILSPSPFTNNRLGGRVVPRVPIRLNTGNQGGKDGGQQDPTKIDPRAVRFTEIVGEILNSLIAAGWIYKAGASDWQMAFLPRRITGPEAFIGELFFSTTTNRLSYKNNDASITTY